MTTVEEIAWMVRITLSTGTVIDIGEGVCGLGLREDQAGIVFTGYDGQLTEGNPRLTAPEACELADVMIARWQAFKDAQAAPLC